MKRMFALAVLGLSGCFSITETQLTFIKIPPPDGIRFFVSDVELSDAVRALPFGDRPASSSLSQMLRLCLVKHHGELFSETPDGAVRIKVAIGVKPNRTGRMANTGRHSAEICNQGYWDSGWWSIMMKMHLKIWSLIYDVKCEMTDIATPQTISRSVTCDGTTTEPPLLFAPILLPFVCFADNSHFNGFGLFPGMVDDYDWLMEKEFADVMASAVAEFDVDSLKGNGADES